MHQLSRHVLAEIDQNMSRLNAACSLATKPEPRASWATVRAGIPTLSAALELVGDYAGAAHEVAVFLEHEKYGGIMVWSSIAPDIANRFDGYST